MTLLRDGRLVPREGLQRHSQFLGPGSPIPPQNQSWNLNDALIRITQKGEKRGGENRSRMRLRFASLSRLVLGVAGAQPQPGHFPNRSSTFTLVVVPP